MADKIYTGDTGTRFLVDCSTDLAGATTSELHVRKPDETEVVWAGAVTETTKIEHYTASGDLDQIGQYLIHSYVVLPSGTWRGELARFTVYDKWK